MTSLESVDLSSNGIGPEGALALVAAFNSLPRLITASLFLNPVGDAGMSAMLSCRPCIAIYGTYFDASGSDIGCPGALAIAAALRSMFEHLVPPEPPEVKRKRITGLALSYNCDIGDVGHAAIAAALAELDLSAFARFDTDIGSEVSSAAAAALFRALASQPLLAFTSLQIDGPITSSALASQPPE